MTRLPARYDAMCRAIAECHSVDEVKDIRDKALALEIYARQAKNMDAERKACEIRIRAEIKTGELLRELPRSKGGDPSVAAASIAGASPYRDALDRTQISERTATRYQQLAEVPKPIVEAALSDPLVRPSTAQILKNAGLEKKPEPLGRIDPDALWIWGRLRDFERDRLIDRDHREVYEAMTDTMQADLARILPVVIDWLTELEKECHESDRAAYGGRSTPLQHIERAG